MLFPSLACANFLAQLLLLPLLVLACQHDYCCHWLIVQFLTFLKIILLPANAGIVTTCMASVFHQPWTIVLLLLQLLCKENKLSDSSCV